MKVAFFTPTRQQCGIADYSRFLLDHLRERADVQVFPCEPLASLDDYVRLGRRMNHADVAHIEHEHGFFLAGDAPAENFDALMGEIRSPKVVTLHCLPLDHPLWQRHLEDPEVSFFVHSRHHRDFLCEHGVRGPVESAPHPATPRISTSVSASVYRRAHGLEQKTVLAIFGFTKRHKGYEVAVEALRRLAKETVLLIAGGPQDEGDAGYLSGLLDQADSLGLRERVRVTGYVPPAEVGAALEASDVVLAPFTSMTASGSIATALAWERPVIAADLQPNVELHDEFACLELFKSGNAVDLTQRIEQVAGDAAVRRSLTEGARLFRRRCTYGALAVRTCGMYERAVERRCESLREC